MAPHWSCSMQVPGRACTDFERESSGHTGGPLLLLVMVEPALLLLLSAQTEAAHQGCL